MTVYHGSTVPVEFPKIMKSIRMLDFGDEYIVQDIELFIKARIG